MKKYILLAAVGLTLTACNTEDNYIDEPVAAQISATIGEGGMARASNVTWDKGDAIGISMSGRYSNIRYATEDGDGMFDGTIMYFKNKQTPVTLTAYYPFSGTEGQPPAVVETSTTADRQTESGQPLFDFLYAVKENVTGAEPNVNLTFNHCMSKLTLTFINGNEGTNVKNITSCEISGLVLEGTFNPLDGACAAKTDAPAPGLSMTPTLDDNDQMTLSLILFPQTVNEVALTIHDNDNQDYSCKLNFAGNSLASGNNYTFTIKVNKTELSVVVYAIEGWTLMENEGDDPVAGSTD